MLVTLLWFIGIGYATPNELLFPIFIFCGYTPPPIEKLFPKCYVGLVNKPPIELLFPTFKYCVYTPPPIKLLFPANYGCGYAT